MLARSRLGAGAGRPPKGEPTLDQTVTGSGFFGSIPYFLIASETTLGLTSP